MTNRTVNDPEVVGPPSHTRPNKWLAVTAVAACSFSLVLSEFLPIGLLTDIADGLDVSAGTAGLLVVMPGLAATVAAPAATVLAGRINRRIVLVTLAGLLVVSNVLAALSPNLSMMLAARILLGIGSGGFWAFGTSVAPRLVEGVHATRATATVTSGIALGTVASLPLGAFIGNVAGWRYAFSFGAALSLLAVVAQLVLLPSLPSTGRTTTRTLIAFMRMREPRTVLIATLLTFLAQFGAYTYLEPYLRDRADFSPSSVTLVLLAFGLAGLAGNFAFIRIIDASPRYAVIGFLTLTAAAIALLPRVAGHALAAIVLVTLWGSIWGGLPIGLQIFMMRTAGAAAEGGQAMLVATLQIGLAAGSALGGVAVDRAGLGVTFTAAAAVALAGAATVVLRSYRQHH
ncbi:MFS transporter [Actinoplanes sp. TBRC 11911]|uniref:MFS transporter n=1 Tax=Actinoplanes sp. TBRC 11911 TaxID=2729386 RepID=UPI00145D94EE|nr:MFS transporter [Actinoplanes sp. TBRC 11911]NMO55346.1 MFS transporter [Actinoplanes sp. TBRC 11911]